MNDIINIVDASEGGPMLARQHRRQPLLSRNVGLS